MAILEHSHFSRFKRPVSPGLAGSLGRTGRGAQNMCDPGVSRPGYYGPASELSSEEPAPSRDGAGPRGGVACFGNRGGNAPGPCDQARARRGMQCARGPSAPSCHGRARSCRSSFRAELTMRRRCTFVAMKTYIIFGDDVHFWQ